MARAFGEVEVKLTTGATRSGVAVDLLDYTTGVRLTEPIYADATSSATLPLPLTTDVTGKAPFFLATGKLVTASYSVRGVTYTDTVAVEDPTSTGGGGGGAPTGPAGGDLNGTYPNPVLAAGIPTVSEMASGTPSTSTYLRGDRTWAVPAGAGTVTSVGLTMPSDFTVTGSPVTGIGTLAVAAAVQAANLVKAGPGTGAPAAPTYRALVAADIPAHTHTAPWQRGAEFTPPAAGDIAIAPEIDGTITALVAKALVSNGTSASVDITRNGTTILATSPTVVNAAATFTTIALSGTPTLAAGDIIRFRITAISGAVTDTVVQLTGSRSIT